MPIISALRTRRPADFDQVSDLVRLYGAQYPQVLTDLIRHYRRSGVLTLAEALTLLSRLPGVQR